MSETITCPSCRAQIEITEALSAQVSAKLQMQFDADRKRLEQQYAERDAKLLKERQALEQAQLAVQQAREGVNAEVQKQLTKEREKLKTDAVKVAREELAVQLQDQQTELQATRSKLAEAQQAEMQFRRQTRELEEQKRELELTVARKLDDERNKIREAARLESDEAHALREAEKDKLINDQKKLIDELKRKSEQGSQQLQGEVMELGLEDTLKRHFPFDIITPVPKGVHGGDVLHEVRDGQGRTCGMILWESKRTKNWSDGWLPKLRDDQRAAKAQISILVSIELPKGVNTFCCQDGVWITGSNCALGLALALRERLVEVAVAKYALNGQQGKMEQLYHYLSGSEFRNRVEGIVEAYTTLREELEAEKRQTLNRWAKREKQLDRAIAQAAGMHGDVQGIVGQEVLSIPSLMPALLEEEKESDKLF